VDAALGDGKIDQLLVVEMPVSQPLQLVFQELPFYLVASKLKLDSSRNIQNGLHNSCTGLLMLIYYK
jgi:hypothetical protein